MEANNAADTKQNANTMRLHYIYVYGGLTLLQRCQRLQEETEVGAV